MSASKLKLADEQATAALGARLARVAVDLIAEKPLVITLNGPLGAGKTTLARGILRALGVRGAVRSPTFTLLETYSCSGVDVVHIDLYRIDNAAAVAGLGLREYHRRGTLWLIEWPQRGAGYLPEADLRVHLAPDAADGRDVVLEAVSGAGHALLRDKDAADMCEAD